jgi:RNA polymerase sigma-70 factor (ECF subfamily)
MSNPVIDNPTFTRMFEEHQAPMRRYVRTLVRDTGEAEDIIQETFLRAHRKLSSLQEQKRLSSWLYRIATNLCHDRFRQISSRSQAGARLEDLTVLGSPVVADRTSPRLDKVFEQREMSSCVREYLEDLSDDYRAVIMLHDFEGMTNAEIAEMLDCSLATAKIRLHRARKKLKAALSTACQFSLDNRGVMVCERKSSDSDKDSR